MPIHSEQEFGGEERIRKGYVQGRVALAESCDTSLSFKMALYAINNAHNMPSSNDRTSRRPAPTDSLTSQGPINM